jgi:hypothetical protein
LVDFPFPAWTFTAWRFYADSRPSKKPFKYFGTSSMSGEKKSEINRQKFRCQFFLAFFCFIAFSGASHSDGSSETLQKRFTKKSCRKVFTKTIDKKIKTDFSSDLFALRKGRRRKKKKRRTYLPF